MAHIDRNHGAVAVDGIRAAWGWLVASGILSAVVGLIFLVGWPVNSAWLLGLLLSVDLIFQGCALIGTGFLLRSVN